MDDLQGRVAVVTGAASGIGKAVATALAGEGMKVVLADIEEVALDAAVAGLADAGHEVLGVRTDVSDAASIDALARRHDRALRRGPRGPQQRRRGGGRSRRGAGPRHVGVGARRRPVERHLRRADVPAPHQGGRRGPHRQHRLRRRAPGVGGHRALQRGQVRRGGAVGDGPRRARRREVAHRVLGAVPGRGRHADRRTPTATALVGPSKAPSCTRRSRSGSGRSSPRPAWRRAMSRPWWSTPSAPTGSGS